MSKIKSVLSREILDSRGNPTVEVEIKLSDDTFGRAAVPSGASTGSREALELRDGDKSRYLGKGVKKALKNIDDKISSKILGMDSSDQRAFDELLIELDGTETKSNLGANALLGVSLANARAQAFHSRRPLYSWISDTFDFKERFSKWNFKTPMPTPLMNIINGGAHADNNLDIQEFMIVPAIDGSFSDNLRAGVETFHQLRKVLSKQNLNTNVGDEGGFAPNFSRNEEALEAICEAISNAGYKPGSDIHLALDVASSEFFKNGKYELSGEGKSLDSQGMCDYFENLIEKYPIVSIEDGLDESDWDGWKLCTDQIGDKVQLVGDDLFVTNPEILARGIDEGVGNSILIKLNQIGTLTETVDAIKMAHENDYGTIISHRSGETEDPIIADVAVGTGACQIKTGSASRSDRMSKYNQLLRIEGTLRGEAFYPGLSEIK